MSTPTVPTTIDLAPLIELRNEIAPTLAELCERIDNDDRDALSEGDALLERERTIIVELSEQLGELTDSERTRRRAVESLNDALTDLCVTGDLFAAVDSFRERTSDRAVDGLVDDLGRQINEHPDVTIGDRMWIMDEVRKVIAAGRERK